MYTAIQPMYLVLLLMLCLSALYFDFFITFDQCGNSGRAALGRFAPDIAVGAWAWVQTRGNRCSRAARTRARRGTSESVWVSRVFYRPHTNFKIKRRSESTIANIHSTYKTGTW